MEDKNKPSRQRRRKQEREEAASFLLEATFATMMKQDLDMEENETRALRRALLALIWLAQGNLAVQPSSKTVCDFIEYLLTLFPPLAEHFDDKHRQFLMRGEDVMRAKIGDYKVGLLLREEFGERLLAEGLNVVMKTPDD